MSGYLVLSTAFLTHPEVSDQVDQQECVRVDSGTGVTQKLSTDFIRVVPQTSRNQFGSNPTRVRIPPAAPAKKPVFDLGQKQVSFYFETIVFTETLKLEDYSRFRCPLASL